MAKRAMVHPARDGDDEVIVTGSMNIAVSPLCLHCQRPL